MAGWTALHGPDHRITLVAQMNLAITLENLGEVDRARALYEAVLERMLATLGPAHADTLLNQLNLANLLSHSLGDYAGARALHEAVVAGYTTLHGATHAKTLTARGNLAVTLDILGDHGTVRGPSPCPFLPRIWPFSPDHWSDWCIHGRRGRSTSRCSPRRRRRSGRGTRSRWTPSTVWRICSGTSSGRWSRRAR
eukprot:COSAG04_NODE_612_length_11991_cov_17.359569_4_plen_195_part_00